jgi:RNA polymerase sigma factor (sigma-70 family)
MLPKTAVQRDSSSLTLPRIDPPLTAALVSAARQGSRAACEALLIGSLPGLRRWARGKLPAAARGHMDTGDLVQDAALLAVTRLALFNPQNGGSMPAYLRQIARHRVCDEFRKAMRRPQSVALDETLRSEQPSPLALAIQVEERLRYRRALGDLRNKDRQLLIARYEREWDFETIAKQFELPSVAAARMAVLRAERRLMHQMEAAGAGPARPGTAGRSS